MFSLPDSGGIYRYNFSLRSASPISGERVKAAKMNVPDTGQKKNKIFLIYLLVAMSRPRHVVSGQLGPARWACGQPRVKDVKPLLQLQ